MYSDLNATNNNLSNAGIPTVKKITDLYAIKKSGFYCYDAGASNAPMSSRGGMVIANYLSDAWISLNVVPYALSKIYTNSKYNSTWTGWSELASKDDLTKSIDFRGNAKTFKVRSGTNGLKNIYLDIEDESGNSCSLAFLCNGVQREHNKKLNNGLPILHKVPPKRDYGRYFCIMAEKGGTSHGGLTEKLSPFFHAKKQEVNAYGR